MVGDEKGWTINFDYEEWANDKEFRVGDNLGNFAVFFFFLVYKKKKGPYWFGPAQARP